MIDLYYFPTPNTWKVSIMLEETGLDYTVKPVNIMVGEQFEPEFLKISPNNRVPAIVDHDVKGPNGQPLSIFESGAILIHLAEKTGKFWPTEPYQRAKVMEWVMWQMGGLGPMGGQANHFRAYAPEQIQYAIDRYTNEVARLWDMLDFQLEGRDWIANNEYSIADMACWGWITLWELQGQDLGDTPNLKRWFEAMGERPAVKRAYEIGRDIAATPGQISDDAKKLLYSQTRENMRELRSKIKWD
ncbi:MAG: glutathione S-transferase N-terminal domain-containing protein [Alphaproteobacteria bacterium]|nr:glutathione S-transferase N-terminal domain-containing protein [Alphaproteobacteria bacterium]